MEKDKKEKKSYLRMMYEANGAMLASDIKPKTKMPLASPSLNWALNGGIYRGFTTCLYGPEGGGKSLISMLAVAALHQSDPEAWAVLISAEMREPSPERLITLGVDPNRLITRTVNTLHDVFDWYSSIDEKFILSNGKNGGPGLRFALDNGVPIKCVIIDSIKSIQGPREQAADSVENDIMMDMSKFLNPALRGIVGVIREFGLISIFVQQVNENTGDDKKYRKWIVPSGQALKHFCETMCEVEKANTKDFKLFDKDKKDIRDLDLQIGHTVRVKVEKANLDKPFRQAEFKLDYNRGVVETHKEIATLAYNLGIITSEKQGYYEYKNNKWHGIEAVGEAVANSPELRSSLMADISLI